MRRKIFVVLFLFLTLSALYLTQGSTDSEMLMILVPNFRLPRLLALVIAGIALSLAGLLIQTVTHNPLADAGTLGVVSGASAGAVTALLLANHFHFTEIYPLLFLLFVILGACLSFSCIYFLGIKRELSVTKILLLGIALTALFQGYITVAQLSMNAFDFQKVAVWLSGDVWQSSWEVLLLSSVVLSLALFFIYRMSRPMEILCLGDESAISLGLDVEKTKRKVYLLSLSLTIISVLLVGGLAFLGLIAPHISRQLTAFKMKSLMLLTGALGALILIASDLLGQLLIYPSSLPLGFVVAFIGAPYYIYLIQKDL